MNVLRQLFQRRRSQSLFECRRCGTNVDAETETCPVCESAEISRYDL
ncbi:hypothetical protein C493_18321 [Natronolimnohabitans innermongolicus JCM 12255]|uniref:Zinc-ribbon domain-containing protein n=1 Tax=Natronolimnohabitans innermongolicus JCM 12255 TaxID=1227499 RepID=L9WRN4_9EURY|nr:hypothetical protein C493_18321 [Natronolimnohabitans innermongolicus JCM 12255]